MAVVIPPWLQVKPDDFLNAAKAGAASGTEQRGQDLEHSARMAAIAQQGADAQMKAQEESERTAVSREVAKNRMALQTAAAANIFQQQQQRQRAIDGGMSPVDAWLQFPGTASGQPGQGAFGAYSQENKATLPLEPVPDPNNPGRTAGFHDGNKFYPLPQEKPKSKADSISPQDKKTVDAWRNHYFKAMADVTKFKSLDPTQATEARKQAIAARTALSKFGVDPDGPSAQAAAPGGGAAAPAPRGMPKPGDVVNGHTFKGGDPTDKNSWKEVNPEGSSFMGTPGQPNEAEIPGDQQDNQPVPDETDDEEQ
jgi:hypothetical protein